jgi:CRISPR/Cas system endoribonuclease Cas6 (RAMP superfamily)
MKGVRQAHVKKEEKEKRRKETFITLSPTRIEVTGFNGTDSRICDDEGQT